MVKFRIYWQKYGTMGMLLLIIAALGIASPKYFLTADNISQVGLQSAVNLLLASGEFFALLIAGIDLSVGAIAGLSGMVTGMMLISNVPVPLAILGGICVGGLLGAINGSLVNATGLHPFVITLVTQAIFRGPTLVISNGRPLSNFPPSFKMIASRVFNIPVPVLIAAVVALLLVFITRKTILGRNIYALGGNRQAAWYAGINIKLHTFIVFVISGVMSGIAGLVMTARIGAAEPLAGQGYETYAIAACIIGGTSFFGGKGKIFGIVIGGLIIGTISNGLNILNVPSFYQQIVMGSLIIASVSIDKLVGNNK